MNKSIIFCVLLVTSQYSHALTSAEAECLARSVYFEARGLSKNDWKKTASVALNRKKMFSKFNFGALSDNLCHIVQSKQYTSWKLVKYGRILEKETFLKIKETLRNIQPVFDKLFFTSKRGMHIYR